MKLHDPTLMTALLDGELKGWRRWFVRRHASNCPVCALEFRQQQHARQLLAANPPRATMSGSDDFFWSRVKSDIQSRGTADIAIPTPALSFADWLRHREPALAAVAALVVVLVAVVWFVRPAGTPGPQEFARVHSVETAIPNTAASAFQSEDDVTVIWVSGLPWTPDLFEMQTLFANPTI